MPTARSRTPKRPQKKIISRSPRRRLAGTAWPLFSLPINDMRRDLDECRAREATLLDKQRSLEAEKQQLEKQLQDALSKEIEKSRQLDRALEEARPALAGLEACKAREAALEARLAGETQRALTSDARNDADGQLDVSLGRIAALEKELEACQAETKRLQNLLDEAGPLEAKLDASLARIDGLTQQLTVCQNQSQIQAMKVADLERQLVRPETSDQGTETTTSTIASVLRSIGTAMTPTPSPTVSAPPPYVPPPTLAVDDDLTPISAFESIDSSPRTPSQEIAGAVNRVAPQQTPVPQPVARRLQTTSIPAAPVTIPTDIFAPLTSAVSSLQIPGVLNHVAPQQTPVSQPVARRLQTTSMPAASPQEIVGTMERIMPVPRPQPVAIPRPLQAIPIPVPIPSSSGLATNPAFQRSRAKGKYKLREDIRLTNDLDDLTLENVVRGLQHWGSLSNQKDIVSALKTDNLLLTKIKRIAQAYNVTLPPILDALS